MPDKEGQDSNISFAGPAKGRDEIWELDMVALEITIQY